MKWGVFIVYLVAGSLDDNRGKEKNRFAAVCDESFYSFRRICWFFESAL